MKWILYYNKFIWIFYFIIKNTNVLIFDKYFNWFLFYYNLSNYYIFTPENKLVFYSLIDSRNITLIGFICYCSRSIWRSFVELSWRVLHRYHLRHYVSLMSHPVAILRRRFAHHRVMEMTGTYHPFLTLMEN